MAELLPVSELVVRAIADQLLSIKTDDAAYRNDVVVSRWRPDGNPKGIADATMQIVVQESIPILDPSVAPGTLDGYRMEVTLFCTPLNAVDYGDAKEQAAMLFLAAAYADVRKAVDLDRNLSGLALRVIAGVPDGTFDGDLPMVTVPLDVIFFTKQFDPYTRYTLTGY